MFVSAFISDHNPDDELVIKVADILSSPGYPGKYPNKVLQKYYLKAEKGFRITLIFIYFQLENHFDFVRIYDGHNYTSPKIADLTGVIDVPHIVSSSGNKVLFVFFSDHLITYKGFKLIYQHVELKKTGK